jgi:hypothetical protein
VPTFCRHNRFIQRCPICRQTLPGFEPPKAVSERVGSKRADDASSSSSSSSSNGKPVARRHSRGQSVRVLHEGRARDDGYRSALVPGLRASQDASRLAEEIGFASGRLLVLGAAPPGVYAQVRAQAEEDLERATWMCFMIAYLSPLEGADPFAGIRQALGRDQTAGEPPDLDGVALGPHSSHDPARGTETLRAYLHWVQRAGSQVSAFSGDAAWSAQRRFERLFERLALPGFGRVGRYDLLVTLGRLGLYELRADSLHLTGARGSTPKDPTTLAAKRVFGIGDPEHIERRAIALAEAVAVPVEALELALANWGTGERATLGFPADTMDLHGLERAQATLEL